MNYSFSEMIKTTYALFLTKIFYRKARLIRRPFYIRGKSDFSYGEGLTTGYNCRFDINNENFEGRTKQNKKLMIGSNCKIGDHVHIVASEQVVMGNDCLLASKIFISDTSHGEYGDRKLMTGPETLPDSRILTTKPVLIGDRVWIGENVVILPGVTIGDGVIIGANAVVNKSIPKNTIVGGIPAKVLKVWNEDLKEWIRA